VLADPIAFSTIIDLIVVHFRTGNVDKVVGIEARGLSWLHPSRTISVPEWFGSQGRQASVATVSEEYSLEYGTATLELHQERSARRTGARGGRRPGHGRDGEGRRVARGADRRHGVWHRVLDRARVPERPDQLAGHDLFTLIRY